MSSLVQIASILAERASKKNDISFIKEMKDLVVIKRGRFLANSLGKNPAIAKNYLNSFEIDLELVDATDECNKTDISECDKIYRSKELIPAPIIYSSNPFDYVGAPGGADAYSWTSFGGERFNKHRPLTGKKARHSYTNNYIYVFNKAIDTVRVEGVFPDPRLIAKFRSCNSNGKPCFDETSDGFIEEQNAELIIKDILQNELRIIEHNEKDELKVDKNV